MADFNDMHLKFLQTNRVLHMLVAIVDGGLIRDFRLVRPHWNDMAWLSCAVQISQSTANIWLGDLLGNQLHVEANVP